MVVFNQGKRCFWAGGWSVFLGGREVGMIAFFASFILKGFLRFFFSTHPRKSAARGLVFG